VMWEPPPDLAQTVTWLRRRACLAEVELRQSQLGLRDVCPPPECRSQWGEETLLWDLLGDTEPQGFFIEAGAYDGYQFSVSYLFECAGWAGLLVEPIPERAAECRSRRSRSEVVQAALTRHGGQETVTMTIVETGEMLSYTELTTSHQRRLATEEAIVSRPLSVPATTLDALLDGHDGTIDLVVLDVEGTELAVLEGFDLEFWQPRVLLIEDSSAGADRSVERHLQQRGYRCAGMFFGNDLYIRSNDRRLASRLHQYGWVRC
jgi:FkbM family methyltransferase